MTAAGIQISLTVYSLVLVVGLQLNELEQRGISKLKQRQLCARMSDLLDTMQQ